MINIDLKTNGLRIRRFEIDDYPSIAPLFFNSEIMNYYVPDQVEFKSNQEVLNYLEDWDDNKTCFLFSCFQADELIAIFTLEDFNLEHKRTECGIALVDPKFYGKGLAKKVVKTMLNYLFYDMNLHKIYIRYIEGNKASYHLFSSLGFKEEGCFRDHIKRKNNYLDLYYMSLLKKEW